MRKLLDLDSIELVGILNVAGAKHTSADAKGLHDMKLLKYSYYLDVLNKTEEPLREQTEVL